ncbi:hypothetical protein ACFVRU_33055, partial [Streptomyces sp. NPDC057927]
MARFAKQATEETQETQEGTTEHPRTRTPTWTETQTQTRPRTHDALLRVEADMGMDRALPTASTISSSFFCTSTVCSPLSTADWRRTGRLYGQSAPVRHLVTG